MANFLNIFSFVLNLHIQTCQGGDYLSWMKRKCRWLNYTCNVGLLLAFLEVCLFWGCFVWCVWFFKGVGCFALWSFVWLRSFCFFFRRWGVCSGADSGEGAPGARPPPLKKKEKREREREGERGERKQGEYDTFNKRKNVCWSICNIFLTFSDRLGGPQTPRLSKAPPLTLIPGSAPGHCSHATYMAHSLSWRKADLIFTYMNHDRQENV